MGHPKKTAKKPTAIKAKAASKHKTSTKRHERKGKHLQNYSYEMIKAVAVMKNHGWIEDGGVLDGLFPTAGASSGKEQAENKTCSVTNNSNIVQNDNAFACSDKVKAVALRKENDTDLSMALEKSMDKLGIK